MLVITEGTVHGSVHTFNGIDRPAASEDVVFGNEYHIAAWQGLKILALVQKFHVHDR